MQSNFITQLLNLKGIKVTKISHGDFFVKIYITTEPRKHTCPACGSKTSRIHDYREQTIKDLPLQFKHTYCIWQVENDEFGNEKMQSLPSR